MRRVITLVMVLGALVLLPARARAQGHMLHGVGPVNSAMGGAGTAMPNESIGALTYNPALIGATPGNQISFTTEFFQDGIRIDTTLNGGLKGTMIPSRQIGVIPAFGWTARDPRKKFSLGFGLIGLAGFRTDYPSDDASILFAQPPRGFGRIYTDYRATKIPVAFAYQVTPQLALGASFNVYIGEFAVAPLPHKVFDTSPAGDRYYPEAGSLNTSWTVGGTFGFYFQPIPMVGIGGSVTTPQNYPAYKWNSTIADPASPAYGRPRTLDFELDGPLIVSWGLGLKPGTKTKVAIDGMFTKYKGVEGFGSPGGIVDGVVYPFGWRNVWTFKTGVEQQVAPKLAVRLGYNYSQMPLKREAVLTATGAPATFQHHFCAGLGIRMFPFLEAEASGYVVPRQHLVGPFPNLQNVVIGQLDESNRLIGGLIGLNFRF